MNPLAPVETTGVQKPHKNGEWGTRQPAFDIAGWVVLVDPLVRKSD